MSVAERFAAQPPARLQWHPAHGEPDAEDPQTFHLHLEFMHAHGLPTGQFTTFSICPKAASTGYDARDGARGE